MYIDTHEIGGVFFWSTPVEISLKCFTFCFLPPSMNPFGGIQLNFSIVTPYSHQIHKDAVTATRTRSRT